jgi:hypothetical protein
MTWRMNNNNQIEIAMQGLSVDTDYVLAIDYQ